MRRFFKKQAIERRKKSAFDRKKQDEILRLCNHLPKFKNNAEKIQFAQKVLGNKVFEKLINRI